MLNFDHDNTYFLLISICKEFGVDPSTSIESEEYFRELLKNYTGHDDEASIRFWLREKVSQNFVSITERPNWIQGSEWPVVEGKPLMFVGQIDIDVPNDAGVFHDATSFYVFTDSHTTPVVVMQQY